MFLEVLMIVKELNQLLGIGKMYQLVIIKSLSFKVHLKPYEEESDSIF